MHGRILTALGALNQEDEHDGKYSSIIYRQGSSRDRRLTRNWRRNREAACFRRRSRRIYLFQFGRKSTVARTRNRGFEFDVEASPNGFRAEKAPPMGSSNTLFPMTGLFLGSHGLSKTMGPHFTSASQSKKDGAR
jgi:hypothetical protein